MVELHKLAVKGYTKDFELISPSQVLAMEEETV